MTKNIAITILFFIFSSPSKADFKSSLEQYGDIAEFGIPAIAGIVAIAHGDGDGLVRLGEGALYTAVATLSLKAAIDAQRPNGTGDDSFPSGHTSSAFQGAAFLQFEYGWKYGVPALLAATVVGYSRVESNHHYWRDVAAGALLATGIQYGVSRSGYSLTFSPFVEGDAVGVMAYMSF
ncbi:phosphatase PAP2 family protein [Parasalinivibrio latis]|uniref:phosphatase PAP2 family protein n=1 Tax=Parasalinivibrio latis TaxID=2952610 RepID=UPI0030E04B80